MNAPRGIKHCATCGNEIDDAQTYCGESCEQVATLTDTIAFKNDQLAKANEKIADLLKAFKETNQALRILLVLNNIQPHQCEIVRDLFVSNEAVIAKAEGGD